jgi:hypothetical protein
MDSHDFHHDDEARAKPRKEKASKEPGFPAIGNSAFQRIMPTLQGTGPTVLDESISRAIHAKRGSGRPLDPGAQRDLGASMGEDFSDVQVHTGPEADHLNRAVSAEAFTTGKDIFFREGKYDPGSNQGRKLLAHELTHVVQQRDAPPKQELTVSDPGDASEHQASEVADAVSSPRAEPAAPVARQAQPEEEEKEEAPVARQAAGGEEEEEVATAVARQEAPEEEEQAATSRVDRQEAPAEEEEEGGGGG